MFCFVLCFLRFVIMFFTYHHLENNNDDKSHFNLLSNFFVKQNLALMAGSFLTFFVLFLDYQKDFHHQIECDSKFVLFFNSFFIRLGIVYYELQVYISQYLSERYSSSTKFYHTCKGKLHITFSDL